MLFADSSPSGQWAQVATAIILIVGAVILALRQFGVLKPSKDASEWEAEVSLHRDRAERFSSENVRLSEENERLSQTRSLEPLQQLLREQNETQERTIELVGQTLDKLASFNGTLHHIEQGFETVIQGLQEATDGLGVVVAMISEIHDLPVQWKGRGRNILAKEGER